MEQQDGVGRGSGSRGILKKRRRMEEKEDPMMEESKLKAVKEELREKGREELEDLMEEESEEDQTTEEEDHQTTDDEEEEAVRYDPRIWTSDPSKFKSVQLNMYGEDYDDDLEPQETEMEMVEMETKKAGSHEEEQKETFVYERGNFIGRDDYWVFEDIPKLSILQGLWVIDISIKEVMKRNRILDLYARELAEKSTLDMYQALLKDPEKAKALPDDFKEKVKYVMGKIQEDPNFQISTYDEDMIEFTFNQFPRRRWVTPYDQLQVIRNKVNGERAVTSGFFDGRAYRELFCDEDTDEQYVAMHAQLEAYLKRQCPEADVLRLNDCCMMWKEMISHVKGMEIPWARLRLKEIALCGVLITRTLERNRLAEEYRKTKSILWELHHKKKAGPLHPDVRAELDKLEDIGLGLFPPTEFLGGMAIWESLVGVRSGREWRKKIELEYEQDRRHTKEMYDVADHLKLKRKVAMAIGRFPLKNSGRGYVVMTICRKILA